MSNIFTICRSLGFALALIVVASAKIAAAQDCGPPPVNIATSSEFRRHWTLYTCSQLHLSAGATVPIGEIPVGFDFEEDEHTCTDSTETVEDHRRFIMQYLSTRQSLLVAECGYRLCQLQHGRASSPVLTAFTHMCGMGFADVAGASPSASISIADPYTEIPWSDATAGRDITVEVAVTNHNPGATLRYQAGRVTSRGGLTAVTRGRLASGTTTSVTIRVRVPRTRPLRGEPVYVPYRVEIRARGGIQAARVTGSVMIYASTDGDEFRYCTDWSHDQCIRCEVTLTSGVTSGWCAGMPTGDASISFTGEANARGRDSSYDTWLAIGLDGGGGSASWCNGNSGGSYRGVGCVGPYSGRPGVRQVTMTIPHVTVGDTRRLEASTHFQTCVALGDGPTACELHGTLTFRSLVDLTPPPRRRRPR